MPNVTDELRNMDGEELENRLNETRQELFNLRFQLVTGALDNTARIGHVRRQVARIETVLREREIAEVEGAEAPVTRVPAAPVVAAAPEPAPDAAEETE